MGALIDLTGMKFERLTVLRRSTIKSNSKHVLWECECTCGTLCLKSSNSLRTGTKSCGCARKDGNKKKPNYLNELNIKYKSEYHAWFDIKARCYNKNNGSFCYYGGRGIKVCDRWLKSFKSFLDDMGPKPSKNYSIDRIDNDGDYTPNNCKWSTSLEQMSNTRRNVLYLYQGELIHQNGLARKLNIDRRTVRARFIPMRLSNG
jgi:hypothetical protein